MKKVFVGTLYHYENEFHDCIQNISSQKNVEVTHVIISNKTEKRAHDELWNVWNSVCMQHDLFVKVDADTVLRSDTTLKEICDLFEEKSCKYAQFYLYDFFTNQNIYGLNCYNHGVVLNASNNKLFSDRVSFVARDSDVVINAEDAPKNLNPVGTHCHNPSNKQSFHWGLRRMIKGDMNAIEKLTSEYQKVPSIQRQYALMGAWASKKFRDGGWDYDDVLFNELFSNAEMIVNHE